MAFDLEHGVVIIAGVNRFAAATYLIDVLKPLFDSSDSNGLYLRSSKSWDVALTVEYLSEWYAIDASTDKRMSTKYMTPRNTVTSFPKRAYAPFAIGTASCNTPDDLPDQYRLTYTRLTTDTCKAIAIWTGNNGAPNAYNTLWNIATTKMTDDDGNLVNKLAMFGGSYKVLEAAAVPDRNSQVGTSRCIGYGCVITSDSVKTDPYYYSANLNSSMTKFEPLYGRLSEPFCDGVYLITDVQSPSISNEGWLQLNGERYFQLGLFLFKE